VFFRNLFIYLTPAARRQALMVLARLVTPGGLLCLGHAEPLDADDPRFRRTGPDGYFLYRRTVLNAPSAPRVVKGGASLAQGSEKGQAGNVPPRVAAALTPTDVPVAELLAQARQQADNGELDLALRACHSARDRFGPSADLYSLLGIIHQARQDHQQATQSFRKALYLEPGHREALLHLMLLCQQQGDQKQAALLRKRLQRLAPSAEGGEA
jgi:chemotaxis protein methyltransferase WspC